MNGVRDPLSRDFNETEAQLRESVWDLALDQGEKAVDDWKFEHRQAARLRVKLLDHETGVPGVGTHREVEAFRRFVDREKVGIAEMPLCLEPAHEHPAGSVGL